MQLRAVAPFTGAWIEIKAATVTTVCQGVAPFTGAWIEIVVFAKLAVAFLSLPSRERGLK